MPYTPNAVPTDPAALSDFLNRELQSLASNDTQQRPQLFLQTLNVAPTKPREGTIVKADGANWNPGKGAGAYIYKNGAWALLLDSTHGWVSVFEYMTPTQVADVVAGTAAVDVTTAVQTAITAGGYIFFPAGTYKLSTALVVAAGVVVHIEGAGAGRTFLLQTGATENGITSSHPSLVAAGSVRNLSIIGGSSVSGTGDGSSGVGLSIRGANGSFQIDNVDVRCFATGIKNDGSFYLRLTNFQILYAKTIGLDLPVATGSAGAGNAYRCGKISNFGYTGAGTTHVGLRIQEASGEFLDTIDITSFDTGVQIKPSATSNIRYLFMTKVLGDTSTTLNWDVDASPGGTIVACEADQCWSSNSQANGGRTKGANLSDFKWNGGWIRDSRNDGWQHQGGVDVRFIGTTISRNSAAANNTYHGFHVSANVSEWALIGCRIGNVSTTVNSSTQLDNVHIDAGTSSNFRIVGCDLRTAGAGGVEVFNGSTVLSWVIRDNLPIQTVGVSNDRAISYSGSSIGTVAAATTKYLSPAGQQATENDTFVVAGRPGVATQFIAQVDTAPGAGQSFTYTVRLNGANTAMTGAISGAASFQVVLVAAFNVSAADTLSIQLVTSAGAAAARHRWVLNVDA